MTNIYDIYCTLFSRYGMQHWWPAETPFEMMVGAILTQNTSWSNVELALRNFGSTPTPDLILSLSEEKLGEIIRPSGYYNQKARRLKNLSRWFKLYNCDAELVKSENPGKIRAELLALDGIGFETADSIMLYAFGKPYFVIDTYTKRLFNRLGFKIPEKYDDIRLFFERRLPYRDALFNEFHALIVIHAKSYCRKSPLCLECPLKLKCAYYNVFCRQKVKSL